MHYQRWRKTGDVLAVRPNLGNRTPRPVPTERTCRVCGMTSGPGLFVPKNNICKPCSSAYKMEWNRKNPEKFQAYLARGAETRRRYELRRQARRAGQDPDFMEAYVAQHDGKCAICQGRYPPGKKGLAIDHDHRTGQFRGLLCTNCNGGLGRFHDDPEVLASAIKYLTVTPADLAAVIENAKTAATA
jgi:hypothetical protein